LFAALDRADVLVFPTLSDGFGMVVTEAFSRGLPVITTNQAGASDLLDHGRNGLIIEAGDSAAIAGALKWCLDNRAALAAMREPALETAKGWQWSDYRRALIEAVATGLKGAGYAPLFGEVAGEAA
jgi:glycosyltransferase involved in cell wall biosynthesis